MRIAKEIKRSADMNDEGPLALPQSKTVVPRMPKGSCITAYVLNYEGYPGMVTSLLEEVGIRDVRIETPPFYSAINYIWL